MAHQHPPRSGANGLPQVDVFGLQPLFQSADFRQCGHELHVPAAARDQLREDSAENRESRDQFRRLASGAVKRGEADGAGDSAADDHRNADVGPQADAATVFRLDRGLLRQIVEWRSERDEPPGTQFTEQPRNRRGEAAIARERLDVIAGDRAHHFDFAVARPEFEHGAAIEIEKVDHAPQRPRDRVAHALGRHIAQLREHGGKHPLERQGVGGGGPVAVGPGRMDVTRIHVAPLPRATDPACDALAAAAFRDGLAPGSRGSRHFVQSRKYAFATCSRTGPPGFRQAGIRLRRGPAISGPTNRRDRQFTRRDRRPSAVTGSRGPATVQPAGRAGAVVAPRRPQDA
jgi:hypothetical protein